jgi:hypothetical protein
MEQDARIVGVFDQEGNCLFGRFPKLKTKPEETEMSKFVEVKKECLVDCMVAAYREPLEGDQCSLLAGYCVWDDGENALVLSPSHIDEPVYQLFLIEAKHRDGISVFPISEDFSYRKAAHIGGWCQCYLDQDEDSPCPNKEWAYSVMDNALWETINFLFRHDDPGFWETLPRGEEFGPLFDAIQKDPALANCLVEAVREAGDTVKHRDRQQEHCLSFIGKFYLCLDDPSSLNHEPTVYSEHVMDYIEDSFLVARYSRPKLKGGTRRSTVSPLHHASLEHVESSITNIRRQEILKEFQGVLEKFHNDVSLPF